ncbi:hypothetical protein [Flavobacterium sp.]|uniref:hypothetical protein n=1 Tax=Flavobacterium sp. TaxID=239 RepID=UPI00391B835D
MKKIFLLLAMLILLQSCFSYKAMDNDPSKMEAGKTYKIERNHKYTKVVFYSIKDSTILVNEKFEEKQIPVKDITNIQKRKFSLIKTLGYPLAVVASIAGLFVIVLSN